MTATFTPSGLSRLRRLASEANSTGVSRWRIANGFDTAMFTGDLVGEVIATGTINLVSTSAGIPLGVFEGCQYNDPNNSNRPTWSRYWPGDTSVTDGSQPIAYVCDDPDATFTIQSDVSVSVGDIGYSFYVSASAGNTVTGQSRYSLAGASRNASTNHVQIIDIYDIPGNAFSDAFPIVEVRIRNSWWNQVSIV